MCACACVCMRVYTHIYMYVRICIYIFYMYISAHIQKGIEIDVILALGQEPPTAGCSGWTDPGGP